MIDNTSVAIHEAAHAVVALAFGVVPTEVAVYGGCGHCSLPASISDDAAAVVGIAGAIAVADLLGHDDMLSSSDATLANHVLCTGRRQHVANRVRAVASELIWLHRAAICDLASELMSRQTLSQAELGNFCRKTPSMKPFLHLFPQPLVAAGRSPRDALPRGA
ncbi:MAG: hypothetical protein KF861_07060 [Planctomycetaceae bacterium]|nr:hypothetical protein [Planctomycetaceae bacterium]